VKKDASADTSQGLNHTYFGLS